MNKAELIDVVTEKLGSDRRQATAAVEHIVDTIVRAVHKGDSVTITGFGVFEQRRRAARVARNPRTGETVKVKPTSVPAFRPGAQFKAVVSGAQKLPADGPAVKRGAFAGAVRKAVAKRAVARKALAKKVVSKVAATRVPAKKVTATKVTATKAPARKVTATKVTATKAPARKVNATKVTATKVTATKAPAKKVTAAKKAPAKRVTVTKVTAAKKAPAKKVTTTKVTATKVPTKKGRK